ncbi:hypothetical protein E4665_11510 [Sporolactobacillus shoreae]|uniref:Uncharacterized protein n=1 Tax=Sporolactobacillus shoreae TaxID=1465501 RepID=A0A4Z0GNE9_9BACL|nr:hypothetical protein [Sporolactobacillus shoreae]TGA97472.1 hypothetical protein E4665_11510 [Sporolactobacillus shoreae]
MTVHGLLQEVETGTGKDSVNTIKLKEYPTPFIVDGYSVTQAQWRQFISNTSYGTDITFHIKRTDASNLRTKHYFYSYIYELQIGTKHYGSLQAENSGERKNDDWGLAVGCFFGVIAAFLAIIAYRI